MLPKGNSSIYELRTTGKTRTKQKSLYQNCKENSLLQSVNSLSSKKRIGYEDTNQVMRDAYSSKRNKQYLLASQILGKLKRIEEFSCQKNPRNQKSRLCYRKILFYYDTLKKLLEFHCLWVINDEINLCLCQSANFALDLKSICLEMTKKLTTVSVMSYNHFIDCSDANISILKPIFGKIFFICDLHASLRNKVLEIFFLSANFDVRLHDMLKRVSSHLSFSCFELFYWTLKVLELFILRLCLADPETVSPEFFCMIVNLCEIGNASFLYKHIKRAYLFCNTDVLFNSIIYFDFKAVLYDFMTKYLSHFEAKVASEKMMQCLISDLKCKTHPGRIHERSSEQGGYKSVLHSSTSDYCSASSSVLEGENHSYFNEPANFNHIYLSILQRNQALVLKYLYSATSLLTLNQNEGFVERQRDLLTGIRTWCALQNEEKSKQHLILEEKYWIIFWEKVFSFFIRLILEVPCHQYGKSAIGIFSLWPSFLRQDMLDNLRFYLQNIDKSVRDAYVMQKILQALVTRHDYELWSYRISKCLAILKTQPLLPTPVVSEQVRTRVGNALGLCLEALTLDYPTVSIFDGTILQKFHLFQATIDFLALTINISTRAAMSTLDLSTYLLLCRSDCVHASTLLGGEALNTLLLNFKDQCLYSFNFLQKAVIHQHNFLRGYVFESQNIVYQTLFCVARKYALYSIKRKYLNRKTIHHLNYCESFPVTEFVDSFSRPINHLMDSSGILSSIQKGVYHGLLSVLSEERKRLSIKDVQTLKSILVKFISYFQEQNINLPEEETANNSRCYEKLVFILEVLEMSLRQKCCKTVNNKVLPFQPGGLSPSHVLTEEEKQIYSQFFIKSSIFKCC